MVFLSLKHALLGFLNCESMTGYQLKQHFDESVRYFWNASLSQIYPTLNQMKEDNLLDVEIVYQDTSPNAKIYHITDKGKEELIKWISDPMEYQPFRSAFMIKIYFGSNVNKNIVITQLKMQMELSKKRLEIGKEAMKHIYDEHLSVGNMKADALYWNATTDYCLRLEECSIAWCEDTIRKIEADNFERKDK